MNTPSTVGTNWKWRIRKNQLSVKLQKEIHAVTLRYGRMNWTEDVEEAAEAEKSRICSIKNKNGRYHLGGISAILSL